MQGGGPGLSRHLRPAAMGSPCRSSGSIAP
jgi:hypothetical protein